MRREKKSRPRRLSVKIIAGEIAATFVMLACVMLFCGFSRNIETTDYTFTQSSRALRNPDRGFYNIYRFWITDAETDYGEIVADKYKKDRDTSLTLIEINLQEYRDGAISDSGLANIEALLDALKAVDKRLIVRFLYDWEGENRTYEPESMDIILGHMGQLEPVLRSHSGQIFIVQGLFIGNWGEMNGTKYLSPDNIQRLYQRLVQASGENIYLAVRTPAQWRSITGISEPTEEALSGSAYGRLGLFNDGILGNETDYGTYRAQDGAAEGPFAGGLRQEELDFQEKLCRFVPNGGEVINDNAYNNFENAVKDLARMHVTYLNRGYDEAVFEKWAKETVKEEGCFDGMDGCSYIERHLGYRFYIESVHLETDTLKRYVSVDITMKNAGFAPIYREPEAKLILYSEEKGDTLIYDVPHSFRSLAGGREAGEPLVLHKDIQVKELSRTIYTVYFAVVDADTGKYIVLANEETAQPYGYPVGTVSYE